MQVRVEHMVSSVIILVYKGNLSYYDILSNVFVQIMKKICCAFLPVVLNGVKLRGNVLAIGWLKGPGEGTLSSLGDLRPLVGESIDATGLVKT